MSPPDRAPPPGRPEVSAGRLVVTLGSAGAIAGFLIVFVYGWAQPRIEAHRAEALRVAVREVLAEPDRYDTLYVHEGALVARPPAAADPRALEHVYVGYDAEGRRVGFAAVAAEPGFQDVIRLLFGYDPETETILGMKVLESRETPGLGDKIEKDSAFVAEFDGAAPPLVGVKQGAGRGPGEVDMITGATISSRTVIAAINRQVERLGPLMRAYEVPR